MKKSDFENQNNLFDFSKEVSAAEKEFNDKKLEVVRLDYVQAEELTWRELFSGFDKLSAITFSSGISFIYELLELFDSAQVIFGCEDIISYSLQEILAYQSTLLDELRKKAGNKRQKLLNRIDTGAVHFYVARARLSHEKLYLLEAADGRKRVVMGSANMSFQAFGGRQRENICYVDGDAAYDWYLSVFESLKEDSTDEITHSALQQADLQENLDELPIAQTVKARKVLSIEPSKEVNDDIRFSLDTKNLAKRLAPIMPKAEKKTNITKISPDQLIRIKRQIRDEAAKEKDLRSEYPQLHIDVPEARVLLNGSVLDINPEPSKIREDVALFLKYMAGYERFHGDYKGMQYRYYEFANWFFCSPFMAPMRDMASRFDQQKIPYPVFGLVYGQSKAGKTSFLETLLLMMIGQKPKIAAPEFTRSSIEGLKRQVEGAPIIVDDLTNVRFNQHAIETIKNDDFGVSDHLVNYSAVVISANEDVKAVAPEVIRRTVICRVEAGLTNTEVMKSNVVRSVQRNIGTALYREYLRRMLDLMPDLMEQLKADEEESPDILRASSEVLYDIIKEYSDPELPEFVRPLSIDNYFSESVTGKFAIKTIRNAWKTSKESFEINRRNNELRYNAGAPYEADRLMKELPETLEAHKSRDWVVMNLDEARDFFDLDFKKSIFPWRL